jgi:sporulation protein YlmC with PRC-barrel domain
MVTAEIPLYLTAKTINGDKVINMAGEHLGKIEDLMIDLENGRVAYAVLSFGGFLGLGNKLFAVPWEALSVKPEEHAFALDVSKEILEKAEGFDKDDWPLTCEQLATSTREWLAKVYTCYGYKPYWETGGPGLTKKEIPGETESEKLAPIEKKSEPAKEEVEEAHVEPIHPSENRGGKKRGLLDTCK